MEEILILVKEIGYDFRKCDILQDQNVLVQNNSSKYESKLMAPCQYSLEMPEQEGVPMIITGEVPVTYNKISENSS